MKTKKQHTRKNKKRSIPLKQLHDEKKCEPIAITKPEPEIAHSIYERTTNWLQSNPIKHLQNLLKLIKHL